MVWAAQASRGTLGSAPPRGVGVGPASPNLAYDAPEVGPYLRAKLQADWGAGAYSEHTHTYCAKYITDETRETEGRGLVEGSNPGQGKVAFRGVNVNTSSPSFFFPCCFHNLSRNGSLEI